MKGSAKPLAQTYIVRGEVNLKHREGNGPKKATMV